jgi:hypothetical protein
MKVITLWAPWGTLIALNWKRIETRDHDRLKSLEGQTIGIHQGNKWDNDFEELAGKYLTEDQLYDVFHKIRFDFERGKTKGKILCTTGVFAANWLIPFNSKSSLLAVDKNKFGLFLVDTKPIKPIPAKGHQGIWNYNGEIIYL